MSSGNDIELREKVLSAIVLWSRKGSEFPNALTDTIMALMEAEIERIEEGYSGDLRDAMDRAFD